MTLIATMLLALLVAQAQAQTSYRTHNASAKDQAFKELLWVSLDARDTRCNIRLPDDAVAMWCGRIGDTLTFTNQLLTEMAAELGGFMVLIDWQVANNNTLYQLGLINPSNYDQTSIVALYVDGGETLVFLSVYR